MKTRYKIIMLIVIIVTTMTVTIIPTQDAFACSCAIPIDYKLTLEKSEYVYIGTVTDVSNQHGRQIVTFDVTDTLKGNLNQTHILDEINFGGTTCGVNYKIGDMYKVYQYKTQTNTDGVGQWSGTAEGMEPEPPMLDLKTNICTTEKISHITFDIGAPNQCWVEDDGDRVPCTMDKSGSDLATVFLIIIGLFIILVIIIIFMIWRKRKSGMRDMRK